MEQRARRHPGRGFFITFEGPEGSGKSTQIQLLSGHLASRGYETLLTREPGGTPLAEQLRTLVKDFNGSETMHAGTELLLIEAARTQHVREKIRPALAAGKIVLCDRFSDSTIAYQGGARGIDPDVIDLLNRFAEGECVPDLTILLDLPPETGFARTQTRAETCGKHDRFEEEALDFHMRVRDTFLSIARREPGRVRVVRANRAPERIHEEIIAIVDPLV